jgi:hypothetical protein
MQSLCVPFHTQHTPHVIPRGRGEGGGGSFLLDNMLEVNEQK